jgi:hypothetical protein
MGKLAAEGINSFKFFMAFLIGKLILRIGDGYYGGGQAKGEPHDIDNRDHPVLQQVPPGGDQVMQKHGSYL